jgi:C4-dicarboxylate-specific signal transduction histidine kinase
LGLVVNALVLWNTRYMDAALNHLRSQGTETKPEVAAGRKNNANGELAAHLADLKRSEALRASQAPEIRRYLEQLNSVQGDILNRLRTLPASLAGDDTWVKRLAYPRRREEQRCRLQAQACSPRHAAK